MNLWIDGFNLFGLEIKFYGILMATAFLVALLFAVKFCKQKGYDKSLPFDLLLIVFPSAIVGARLNYVLFTLDRGWTFLEVLQIWNGGLMIYGGVLFAVIAIIIYCLVKKISILQVLDMLAPCLILGQAIGRWGNFFNQEAYGALITNSAFQWFPFGVWIESSHFTESASRQVFEAFGTTAVDGAWFNATFFYESFWCLLGFVALYFIYKKTNSKGLTTASYFVIYGFERFFVEMLRTDSLYLGSIKISVLISAILFIVGVVWIAYILIKKHLLSVKSVASIKQSNDISNNKQVTDAQTADTNNTNIQDIETFDKSDD